MKIIIKVLLSIIILPCAILKGMEDEHIHQATKRKRQTERQLLQNLESTSTLKKPRKEEEVLGTMASPFEDEVRADMRILPEEVWGIILEHLYTLPNIKESEEIHEMWSFFKQTVLKDYYSTQLTNKYLAQINKGFKEVIRQRMSDFFLSLEYRHNLSHLKNLMIEFDGSLEACKLIDLGLFLNNNSLLKHFIIATVSLFPRMPYKEIVREGIITQTLSDSKSIEHLTLLLKLFIAHSNELVTGIISE